MGRNQRPDDVRGWIALSDDRDRAVETITHGVAEYDINHLQLSHHIIRDLREIRGETTNELVTDLARTAKQEGIEEVAVWDHSLYDIEYYPDEFKTEAGELDFDHPGFWEWFVEDYRDMLDSTPTVDALILTFIETGAHIREQHSEELTESEMIARVVNTIAAILEGYDMRMYARTFAYSPAEYDLITGAVDSFEHENIRLMMKEAPHDFHLPHPHNPNPSQFDRDTIVEFDVTGEFHGQGIVQNTFPEQFLERASSTSQEGRPGLLERDSVIGYCARMDRYGDTHIVNTPTEINAAAIDAYAKDPSTTPDDVYESFVTDRYGAKAAGALRNAFENGLDITLGTFYTLGTNTADHSRLNYDPYSSSYGRHVSGRWLEPPKTYVPRGVDREFHYWKDIVYRLAPNWAKQGGTQLDELSKREIEWMGTDERMNEEYLRYVLTEKDYCIDLARENLNHLAEARPHLATERYENLKNQFEITRLCLRLRREAAAAYWGFRVWARGKDHRSEYVTTTLDAALSELLVLANELESITPTPPAGQWNPIEDDPEMARRYHAWITEEGWPEELHGVPVSFGGVTYDPG